jgi:molybdate transport system substrate-binding protein
MHIRDRLKRLTEMAGSRAAVPAIRCLAAVWLIIAPVPDLLAQRAPAIAAASNLNFALVEVAKQFEHDRGTRIDLVFGASGTLTRQIQDGAPFEMFLAADEEFPNKLAAAGLTRDPGVVYAVGRLVVFAPTGSPLSPDERLEGLARALAAGTIRRFAMANPEVAPYGRAAEAVLRKRGLWDGLRPYLVLGDTISQAAQFATTGNAAGGLIAYSLALAPGLSRRGTYALVPDADHPPLRQKMVLLKKATPVVEQFFEYVQGSAAQAILRRHGFEVPK